VASEFDADAICTARDAGLAAFNARASPSIVARRMVRGRLHEALPTATCHPSRWSLKGFRPAWDCLRQRSDSTTANSYPGVSDRAGDDDVAIALCAAGVVDVDYLRTERVVTRELEPD
jgi:hypothetical protein